VGIIDWTGCCSKPTRTAKKTEGPAAQQKAGRKSRLYGPRYYL